MDRLPSSASDVLSIVSELARNPVSWQRTFSERDVLSYMHHVIQAYIGIIHKFINYGQGWKTRLILLHTDKLQYFKVRWTVGKGYFCLHIYTTAYPVRYHICVLVLGIAEHVVRRDPLASTSSCHSLPFIHSTIVYVTTYTCIHCVSDADGSTIPCRWTMTLCSCCWPACPTTRTSGLLARTSVFTMTFYSGELVDTAFVRCEADATLADGKARRAHWFARGASTQQK